MAVNRSQSDPILKWSPLVSWLLKCQRKVHLRIGKRIVDALDIFRIPPIFGGVVRIIDDRVLPIIGVITGSRNAVLAILLEVANAPVLGYILLSLKIMADHDRRYVIREKMGATLFTKIGKTPFSPSVRKLYNFSGFLRRPLDLTDCAGNVRYVPPGDVNTFYSSHGHMYEMLLCSTVNQLKVAIEGTLRVCEGCSVATGFDKLIGRTTSTRSLLQWGQGLQIEFAMEWWMRI